MSAKDPSGGQKDSATQQIASSLELQLEERLKTVFKFDNFRGDQKEIILAALRHESSLVLMPTGMGKSLCYQMPALMEKGLVLVISPLIALMQDQVEKIRKWGISASSLNSSLAKEEREDRQRRLAQGEYQILYVTPERFKKPEFCQAIAGREITLLAVDEAHCISQWGNDFRPDYSRLGEIRQRLGNPVTMALTASATPEVQTDIQKQLGIEGCRVFSSGMERPNLRLHVHDVYGLDEKIRWILALRHQFPGPGLVYFSLISTLYKVSQELQKLGVEHLHYHGDLKSQERSRQQNFFLEQPAPLMLATPAFGLGVDKPDIRLLIHAETPNSIESYYQEVGRAGRDEKPAACHLLFDQDDVSIQMEFIKWANPEPGFVAKVYALIAKNRLQIEQEGFDFLRTQMNFYNRRDYRVETAVNLLERWGCLKEDKSRFGYACVQPPDAQVLAQVGGAARVKIQNAKLLEMVYLAQKPSGCRWQQVYKYFGFTKPPCGNCDLCALDQGPVNFR